MANTNSRESTKRCSQVTRESNSPTPCKQPQQTIRKLCSKPQRGAREGIVAARKPLPSHERGASNHYRNPSCTCRVGEAAKEWSVMRTSVGLGLGMEGVGGSRVGTWTSCVPSPS
jgi:hypothetical protein